MSGRIKKNFLVLASLLALPLFCRDTVILNPNDPSFFWMDQLVEKEFQSVQELNEEDFVSASKVYQHPLIALFRTQNNKAFGPRGAILNMLQYLCEHYSLPDLKFYYWNHDGIQSTISSTCRVPIFVGARGKKVSNSILFNDWYFDILNREKGWNHHISVIQNSASLSWDQKIEKAFWRGSGTDLWSGGLYSVANWPNHIRGKACFLSLKYPDLIDAAFTHFYPWDRSSPLSELMKVVPMSPKVPVVNHLDYKYQLLLCGKVSTYPRDRWQFYSGCLVFWPDFPHESFWHSIPQGWVHYIPVLRDLSDLVEKIMWAKNNDEKCREIAASSKKFAEEHLMPEHIALYCYKILMKYASLLQFSQTDLSARR